MFHLSCCPLAAACTGSSVRTKRSLGRLISTPSLLFDTRRIGMKLNAFFPPYRDMHRGLNTPWQILLKWIQLSSVSIYRQPSIKGLQECFLLFCPSPQRIIFGRSLWMKRIVRSTLKRLWCKRYTIMDAAATRLTSSSTIHLPYIWCYRQDLMKNAASRSII